MLESDVSRTVENPTRFKRVTAKIFAGRRPLVPRLLRPQRAGNREDGQQRAEREGADGRRHVDQDCRLDQDEVPGIELKAELNVLVFKVANGINVWVGSVRFTTADGRPVPGLNVTLDPDAVKERPRFALRAQVLRGNAASTTPPSRKCRRPGETPGSVPARGSAAANVAGEPGWRWAAASAAHFRPIATRQRQAGF